jgi:hypothetical protein
MEKGPIEPIELVGSSYVAKILDIADLSALKLMRAGIAGPLYTFVQYEMVGREEGDRLKDRRPLVSLQDLPPAFIARVGPPDRSGADEGEKDNLPGWTRPWKGWHAFADPHDQLAGISRWWPIREPARLAGRLFVAAVSGWTVHVARISHEPPVSRGTEATWALNLVDPDVDDADANQWRRVRTKMPGGGGVLRHRLD